jgi:hypothetical protein
VQLIFFFRTIKSYFLGVQLTETVIAQTTCAGQSVVDFVTSSPIGMTHSVISNPSAGKQSVFQLKHEIFFLFEIQYYRAMDNDIDLDT